MNKKIEENAPAGAVSATSIATAHGRTFSKPLTRMPSIKNGKIKVYKMSSLHDYFNAQKKKGKKTKYGGGFDVHTLKDTMHDTDGDGDGGLSENVRETTAAVRSRLSSLLQGRLTPESNYVTYGVEDDKGNIYKVRVAADDVQRFEQFIKDAIDAYEKGGKQDIVELLYTASKQMNIVDIEWPEFQGTEQEESEVVGDEGNESEGEDTDTEQPEEQDEEEQSPEDSESIADLLKSVVSMLKADIEARKKEMEARKAEAEAEALENKAEIEKALMQRQEEVLDMEAYYAKKAKEEQKAKELQRLAQYRHEIAQQSESVDPLCEESSIDDDVFEPGWYVEVVDATAPIFMPTLFGPFETKEEAEEERADVEHEQGIVARVFFVNQKGERTDGNNSLYKYLSQRLAADQ